MKPQLIAIVALTLFGKSVMAEPFYVYDLQAGTYPFVILPCAPAYYFPQAMQPSPLSCTQTIQYAPPIPGAATVSMSGTPKQPRFIVYTAEDVERAIDKRSSALMEKALQQLKAEGWAPPSKR